MTEIRYRFFCYENLIGLKVLIITYHTPLNATYSVITAHFLSSSNQIEKSKQHEWCAHRDLSPPQDPGLSCCTVF